MGRKRRHTHDRPQGAGRVSEQGKLYIETSKGQIIIYVHYYILYRACAYNATWQDDTYVVTQQTKKTDSCTVENT